MKAKALVKTAKTELDEMTSQMDKLQVRCDKIDKERLFIKQQYDELVDKRNQQFITHEDLCPKCKVNKQCLDEILHDFKEEKSKRKFFEEEARSVCVLYAIHY